MNIEDGIMKQKINVILDDVPLKRVNSKKFIGVIIDENLTSMQYLKRFQEILVC